MPYKLVHGKGDRPWKIIRLADKKVVGTSQTKAKAIRSLGYRVNGENGGAK
jgi:hypothetical protein